MDMIFGGLALLIAGIAVSFSLNDLGQSSQLSICIEIYIGLFALKYYFDDLAHFKTNSSSESKEIGFLISLFLWFSITGAFVAAPIDVTRSAYYLIIINLAATIWIALNHIGVASEAVNKKREVAWAVINCIHILVLSTFLMYYDSSSPDIWVWAFIFLSGLVVYDFFTYKTISRLVAAYS